MLGLKKIKHSLRQDYNFWVFKSRKKISHSWLWLAGLIAWENEMSGVVSSTPSTFWKKIDYSWFCRHPGTPVMRALLKGRFSISSQSFETSMLDQKTSKSLQNQIADTSNSILFTLLFRYNITNISSIMWDNNIGRKDVYPCKYAKTENKETIICY